MPLGTLLHDLLLLAAPHLSDCPVAECGEWGGEMYFEGDLYQATSLNVQTVSKNFTHIISLHLKRSRYYYYHHFIDKSTAIVRLKDLLKVEHPNQPNLRAQAFSIYFILLNLLFCYLLI